MNILLKVVCFLFIILSIGCGRKENTYNNNEKEGKSTPYKVDSILLTYGTNPEGALMMLDSAVALGNIDEFNGMLCRAHIFSRSLTEQHQDSALRICELLLEHDSVKNDPVNRSAVLNLLINISLSRDDDNEYLHWATEKADLCRERGEQVELLRTEAEIALVMTRLGQLDEGMAKLDKCISELDKKGSIDYLDAYIVALKRKIRVLFEYNRNSEVIPLAQRILDALDDFEKNPEKYAEDCYRLANSKTPEDKKNYIEFYRAQVRGLLARAYAHLGNKTKARQQLSLFEQTDYAKTFSGRRMIIPAQISLGIYDEAMETCDKILDAMGTDTLNTAYCNILNYRAIVAYHNGNLDEAFHLMTRHALLSKYLYDSLHRSEAHENAARYHAKEQQLVIQQAQNERKQTRIIIIAIASLFVIMTVAAIRFNIQNRHIARKNHVLVRMINESQQRQADKTPQPDLSVNESEETAAETEKTEPEGETTDSPAEAQLFATINSTIRSERIYSNCNLQRQDVCDRFGISRVKLNNILLQFCGNASFPRYINSIRMEEAVRLLREYPNKSITSIAEHVGFSPANLRMHFIREFGITPQEYRQNL